MLTTMTSTELSRHICECRRDYEQYLHDFGPNGQKTIDAKALLNRALAESRRRAERPRQRVDGRKWWL